MKLMHLLYLLNYILLLTNAFASDYIDFKSGINFYIISSASINALNLSIFNAAIDFISGSLSYKNLR